MSDRSKDEDKEKIFVTGSGELVLCGIPTVGINHAVDFGDVYHYPPDEGIPSGKPVELKHDVFWGRKLQEKKG